MRMIVASAVLGIAVSGNGAAAFAQSPDALILRVSGSGAQFDCNARPASVIGSGNRLTLHGPCRALSVTGSDNIIAAGLGAGSVIRIEGDNNRVLYDARNPAPEAVTHGAYNEVLPGPGGIAPLAGAASPGPQAPPPLALQAPAPVGGVSCQGRDVIIRADYQVFDLRGGCRSLTVEGAYDTIKAELVPGAPVTIAGPAVIVNYALVADGPPPIVQVTAAGLHATQLQRYGETTLAIPSSR